MFPLVASVERANDAMAPLFAKVPVPGFCPPPIQDKISIANFHFVAVETEAIESLHYPYEPAAAAVFAGLRLMRFRSCHFSSSFVGANILANSVIAFWW